MFLNSVLTCCFHHQQKDSNAKQSHFQLPQPEDAEIFIFSPPVKLKYLIHSIQRGLGDPQALQNDP